MINMVKKTLLLMLIVSVVAFGYGCCKGKCKGCGHQAGEHPTKQVHTTEHPAKDADTHEHPAKDVDTHEHPAKDTDAHEHPAKEADTHEHPAGD